MKNDTELQEAEWLDQAVKGNGQAFAQIVEAYQVPVYNLCYRMLGNSSEAEDAAQETFLRAYRGLRRYDSSKRFLNWILSIASHYCIDRIRRRRIKTVPLEKDLLVKEPTFQGPEAVLTVMEQRKSVQDLIEILKPRDREVVILRYWYEMSYEEIAQTLDLTLNAVKSRLHRSRKQLAKQWLQCETLAVENRGKANEATAF